MNAVLRDLINRVKPSFPHERILYDVIANLMKRHKIPFWKYTTSTTQLF